MSPQHDEHDACPSAHTEIPTPRTHSKNAVSTAHARARAVPEAVPGPVHWAEALAELHRWSAAAMTAGPDVPVFGSPAWCSLADEDPGKAFAAARAAMAWWAEQEQTAQQHARDHVEASHAIADADDWAAVASEPSHAELERRRRRDS